MKATENITAFIRAHRTEDIGQLAFSMPRSFSAEERAFALQQIEGWQRLRSKVPSWAACEAFVYPNRLALEQCSGETTARYKATLLHRLLPEGGTLADLTGGLGVDFFFMARERERAVYVEQKSGLKSLVEQNLRLMGLKNADFINADGVEFLRRMEPVDIIFLDPARRAADGRKTVGIADCEPDILPLLPLLKEKARFVLLKLSPMLDIKAALDAVGCVVEVHVVASRGECKELLLLLDPHHRAAVRTYCQDDTGCFSFFREEEISAPAEMATLPLTPPFFLYEPSPAVLKAGAFRLPAHRFHLKKLHADSHLYISDQPVENFPGRTFKAERVSGFSKQELRQFIGQTKKANLTVRNFPLSVSELRKRLKISEGGDEYWFATTAADNRHLLIAAKKMKKNEPQV